MKISKNTFFHGTPLVAASATIQYGNKADDNGFAMKTITMAV